MHSTKDASHCFQCHDRLTRQALPFAQARLDTMSQDHRCLHQIKKVSSLAGADKRPVTALCLSCHKSINGYVAMVNIASNRYVEVDIAQAHPIGLMPTETIHPKTLPLSKQTGAITCITCHDQHGTDRRMHLLRLYYPGNGHPPDFRPLCNDCHEEGWLPLKPFKPDSMQKAAPARRKEV